MSKRIAGSILAMFFALLVFAVGGRVYLDHHDSQLLETQPATAQAETGYVSSWNLDSQVGALQEAGIHSAIGARAHARTREAAEAEIPKVENPVVPTAVDFQNAKANIQRRMQLLERLLSGDAQKEASWKRILHWTVLDEALKAEPVDAAGLKDVFEQLNQGVAGLELEYFAALRHAVGGYLRLEALRANDAKAQWDYANALAAVQNLLATDCTKQAGDTQRTVEAALEWLQLTGATQELVQKAKAIWNKPNMAITVRSQLLEDHVNLVIQQKQPIQEQLGPSQITGSADFTGNVRVQFVPSANRASLSLTLDGEAIGKSYTFARPVHVWTDSTTHIHASKRISLDGYGFYASKTQASVVPSSKITGVRDICNRHMIEMFAYQIANTQKDTMQSVLGQRQSYKVGQEFDTQLNPILLDLNEKIATEFWPHLIARGFSPNDVKMSTSADQLNITATTAGNGRLTASENAPALEMPSDIEFSIHETAIQNLLVGFMGNMNCNSKTRSALEKTAPTVVQKALTRMQEKSKAANQGKPQTAQNDMDAWSIAFAEAPVSVTFADNKLKFVIHTNGIQGTDKSYPAVNITIVYRVETRDGKLSLVQDAPVDILPPTFDPTKGKRLPAEIVSLRRVMSRRLQEILPKEVDLDPVTIPLKSDLMGSADKGTEGEATESKLVLTITTFTAKDGWLQVGLDVAK